ncbi:lipoyl(octanoyl) transferase LipB [Desulfonema magnum]|nr:lipoyl(octanoyl) transferase LipB [Desulfonema magnum]
MKLETGNSKFEIWLCAEMPVIEYGEAWDLQVELVAARRDGRLERDVVLLLEHLPVFTLGRRGGLENLIVSEAFLKESGIPVFHAERGGNITFHGPGQLVGYPIINLQGARLSVTDYVEKLEEVMIRTAADFGVQAERNPMNRGVWVSNNKLGSIGIAVRRGICFHGFAFNVNLSLEPFGWINPCGLHGIGVTTLEQELLQSVSMKQVRKSVRQYFQSVFKVELAMTDISELQRLLKRAV